MPTIADELVGEVHDLLEKWQRRFENQPELERRQLLLLALEREQIVAVAYREDVVADRVAELPLGTEARRLIRQCLVWIWKDEELHATYLRGLLLRAARPLPTAMILRRQLIGAVAGWVTSPRHYGAGRAPMRGVAADLLVRMARASGRISPTLANELEYRSFHRYCELNLALERTAELAYGRLIDLTTDANVHLVFERIRGDERRHGQAFEVLADALDERDRLISDGPRSDLAARLGPISPFFLPASLRTASHAQHSGFASGSPVSLQERLDGRDLVGAVRRCLDESGVGSTVRERGARVAIRTSFMLGYDRRDRSKLARDGLEEPGERRGL